MVNVAVGSPAALVATEVESDSHGGNAWVGAVIKRRWNEYRWQGGGQSSGLLEGAGIGAVGFRENVDSSCKRNVKRRRQQPRRNDRKKGREKGGEEERLCGRKGKGVPTLSLVTPEFNFPIRTT